MIFYRVSLHSPVLIVLLSASCQRRHRFNAVPAVQIPRSVYVLVHLHLCLTSLSISPSLPLSICLHTFKQEPPLSALRLTRAEVRTPWRTPRSKLFPFLRLRLRLEREGSALHKVTVESRDIKAELAGMPIILLLLYHCNMQSDQMRLENDELSEEPWLEDGCVFPCVAPTLWKYSHTPLLKILKSSDL